MKMAELKAELINISDHFMTLATEQRIDNPGISYRAFHISEVCRNAAEKLQQDPVEKEIEGGGNTWWHVCEECHGTINDSDRYCRHCGRPFV